MDTNCISPQPTQKNERSIKTLREQKTRSVFCKCTSCLWNTLHAHLESRSQHRVFISAKIVEDVIADLIFHPDDIEGVTQKYVMALFQNIEDYGKDGIDNVTDHQDDFAVEVKTCCHFDLCIRFVACGASFRMASCLMDCTKDESGMSVFGGCSDVVALNYTCIVCAHSL